MRAKLFSKQGVMKGKQFEFDNEATIGRSEQNEITLKHNQVSKVHARIFLDPSMGCYYLENLASVNGTQLDGVKVYGRERLGHLHVITFSGAFDFIFIDSELCKKRHPAQVVAPVVDVGARHAVPLPDVTLPPQSASLPRVEEHHFYLSPNLGKQEAPKNIVDKTIVEEKPFVLPQGLGKGKPVETEDKTMVEEKPFVLPQGLGKGKPVETEDKTMVEEKPFVLPQGLGKGKGGTPSAKEKDGTK